MKLKPPANTTSEGNDSIPGPINNKRVISPEDIAELRDGKVEAYDRIFRAWYNPIYYTLTKLTGSQVEAEDIAQNVFTDLWVTREKLDPEKKMNTYLYRLARNSAIDYFRRKRVTDNHLLSMDWDGLSPDSSEDLVIEKEVKLLKKMALSRMPATQRDIYRLSHEEGLSTSEIAARLGVTKETVYSLKSRARKQLEDLFRLIAVITMFN